MGYRIINGKAYRTGDINNLRSISYVNNNIRQDGSFKDILSKAIEEKKQEYTLSKHAAQRLKEVNFSEEDMKNIGKGFKLAEDKGAKSSVMVYKDVALIASIENRTIITAVDKERAENNVFTNIDSVVIL